MDAFAWAIAFVLMVFGLGGSAVGCVYIAERGKTKRLMETEKTARQGMENAWQLESAKLTMPELTGGKSRAPSEVSFTLDGRYDV